MARTKNKLSLENGREGGGRGESEEGKHEIMAVLLVNHVHISHVISLVCA